MAKKQENIDGLSPKEKEMKEYMEQIDKDFGKGTIIKASDGIESYGDVIPVTSIGLTDATGIGGFPKNKIVEIIGWESSGKSTICSDIIAGAQKTYGDNCLLLDKENSFDPFYAEKLGVDLQKLKLAYPSSLEDQYNVVEKALDSKLFGVIVVDSLTAFEPKAKKAPPAGEKKAAGAGMGGESRINSDRLRMVNDKVRTSGCLVIYINQLREKIGVMFGNPETTSGGNALKFYAHMRLMIRRKEIDVESKTNVMTFKMIKNKMASPMKEAEMTIIWGEGFDVDKEVIDYAVEMNIITKENAERTKSGNTWFYGDVKLDTGEEKAIAMIKDNPELLAEMKVKVINKLKGIAEFIEEPKKEESGIED